MYKRHRLIITFYGFKFSRYLICMCKGNTLIITLYGFKFSCLLICMYKRNRLIITFDGFKFSRLLICMYKRNRLIRNKHKLVTFYKIMHGLAPNYLSDLLPPIVGQTNNYALRNADHIQSFRSKTNLFSDSFFPSTIKAWNSLPNEAKELSSVLAFKNYLNRNKL